MEPHKGSAGIGCYEISEVGPVLVVAPGPWGVLVADIHHTGSQIWRIACRMGVARHI